jgi:hypothetical protein
MKYSISQLAAMTGKDRRTVTARVQDLDYEEGDDRAHLYESVEALAAIYLSVNAKESLDEKRCQEIDLNMEIKRKLRIPFPVVEGLWDSAIQSFTAQLKAARGKKLTVALINELIGILRGVELPRTW